MLRPLGLGVMLLGAAGCTLISDADRYSVEAGSVDPPGGTDTGNDSMGQGGSDPGALPSANGGSGGEGPSLEPTGQGGSGLSGVGGASPLMPSDETPPDVVVPPTCDNPAIDFDRLFTAVGTDLAGRDAVQQTFSRYISLTNRFTAGNCPDVLERDRRALFKMMNMLSRSVSIARPQSINAEQTLFRIDLRDYDWDRAIDVDGVSFADVWEAVALNNPYAVPFVGDDADDAVADTGTAFPIMFADQMLDVAAFDNLYYAIIDLDVNQTLPDFILNELEIDLVANLDAETSVRAGTRASSLTREGRLFQRDASGVAAGQFLWQAVDLTDTEAAGIFNDPLGFPSGETFAIFTLPNAMLGFAIADVNGVIRTDSDVILDFNMGNFRAQAAVSCSGCHANGIFPVVDEVREFALANAVALGLNSGEVDQLQAVYPLGAEFTRIAEADSASFQQALLEAGAPMLVNEPIANEPISSLFARFDEDMRLADAAGDFGITPEDLRDNLQGLNQVARVLADGSLDRDDFTSVFVDSLCRLSLALENQPDPAACVAAAAALGN